MLHPGADIAAALAHHSAGRLTAAATGYRAILRQQPQHPEASHLLGLVLHQAGDDAAAAGLIRQAIAAAPRTAVFHANLGVVLLRARDVAAAATALRDAVRLDPSDFAAQSNLGVALSALGDHAGAVKAAGAALRLRPGDAATLCNRGQFLEKSGQYALAAASYAAALTADATSYPAHMSAATLQLTLGRTEQALATLDAAIPLRPGDPRAAEARVVAMNYLPGVTVPQLADAARRLAPPASPAPGFPGLDRAGDRPLRIGYVSGDFRNHPVGYFLHGVLAARDRAEASVCCYDNGLQADVLTARLQATADHWRPIAALDDEAAGQLIRADGIDILVDLAGPTQGNRLGLFARRSAPVQAAWLGYFGTTGLAAMDAVIADRHVLPPADEATFTERVVRLPDSYLCFSPPAEAGPVAALPAGLNGPVTFGCFNNRAKLNPAVFALWAQVLEAVPQSRLLLKSAPYADKTVRREVTDAFAGFGIAPARILFEPATPIAAMFEAYGRVDIALDPFPFAGGATTAQALWMGVPVVSLAGTTWPGRQGASLLGAAGFPQWAVADAGSYIALAQRLALDRPALMTLRQNLRATVAASALCRADAFARHLQQAYRSLWHDYLRRG